MPYRGARSVAESSEGPTASKSDRTGQNPGMTRLVRRSSATSGGTAFFSRVQTFRQRMRKLMFRLSDTYTTKKMKMLVNYNLLQGIEISVDCTGINVT